MAVPKCINCQLQCAFEPFFTANRAYCIASKRVKDSKAKWLGSPIGEYNEDYNHRSVIQLSVVVVMSNTITGDNATHSDIYTDSTWVLVEKFSTQG